MAPVTRKRKATQPTEFEEQPPKEILAEIPAHDSEDSDDDAPEEVANVASKAAQQEQIQQEREAVRQKNQQKKTKKAGKGKPETDNLTDEQTAGKNNAPSKAQDADEDLLPDDVLQAIATAGDKLDLVKQQKLKAAQEQQQQAQQGTQQLKKRKKLESIKKGPVTVSVLKSVTKKAATGSTTTFLKDHLHGGRLTRSAAMLQPQAPANQTGGIQALTRVLGPAPKFV